MQAFNPLPLRAAARSDLPDGLRYMGQRWAELLDPGAGFPTTPLTVLSPSVTFATAERLAWAHLRNEVGRPSYGVLYDALQRCASAIDLDRNLIRWWPAETHEAQRRLRHALRIQAEKSSGDKQRHLFAAAWPAFRLGINPLRVLCDEASHGYRVRLLDQVLVRATQPLSSYGDWESFDADLRQLAAICRHDGRTDWSFVGAVPRSIASAGTAAEATGDIKLLFEAEQHEFEILFSIQGVKSLRIDVGDFGCRRVDDRSSWSLQASLSARRAFNEFVRNARSAARAAIAIRVTAWNTDDAVRNASSVAERLLAQTEARHRTYTFKLDDRYLVLRQGRGVQSPSPEPVRAIKALPLTSGSRSRLDEPVQLLRVATRARQPAIAVLMAWMALEALALGGDQPRCIAGGRRRSPGAYDVLTDKLPRVLALHAVRLGLVNLWEVVDRAMRKGARKSDWQRIATWLQLDDGRRLTDVNRWVDLVTATPPAGPAPPDGLLQSNADAAWLLEELGGDLTPFVSRRLWLWRARLGDNRLMASWASVCEREVAGHLNRLYSIRNGAVHNGLISFNNDAVAAAVGSLVLDVALEVLADWVPDTKQLPTGRGLDDVYKRSERILRMWAKAQRRPVAVNVHRLTSPGGDGLMRP